MSRVNFNIDSSSVVVGGHESVSKSRIARDVSFEFTLPDASAGGAPLSSAELATDHDAVLVVLLRSHYCPCCRELVQSLADAYQSFAARSTAVVPVLPDRVERGAVWHRRYELPFPILADPDPSTDENQFDTFERVQQYCRERPGGVLFRTSSEGNEDLRMVTTFGGETPQDFPAVEEIIAEIEARSDEPNGTEAELRADS